MTMEYAIGKDVHALERRLGDHETNGHPGDDIALLRADVSALMERVYQLEHAGTVRIEPVAGDVQDAIEELSDAIEGAGGDVETHVAVDVDVAGAASDVAETLEDAADKIQDAVDDAVGDVSDTLTSQSGDDAVPEREHALNRPLFGG
jgi:uncharacterized protein YjbJ (UPF0337 family)